MFQKGLHLQAAQEVPLLEIDEVRIHEDGNSRFYGAADLEILGQGQVKLKLRGVPGAQAFRHAILNACKAWVPGKAAALDKFVSAAAATAAAKSACH